jgi:hypothetical protein
MPKIGSVYIDVVYADQPKRSVKVTSHPVESGENISDHVKSDPYTINISGVVVGPDAAARLKKLEAYQRKGAMVAYVHRTIARGVVIEKFDTDHNVKVANGFAFTITLRQIRVAKATPIVNMKVPAKSKIQELIKKGQQQKEKPKAIKEKKKKQDKKKGKEKDKSTKAVKSKTNGLTPAQAAAKNGNRV